MNFDAKDLAVIFPDSRDRLRDSIWDEWQGEALQVRFTRLTDQTPGEECWVSKPSLRKQRGHRPILQTSRGLSRSDPRQWGRCWYSYYPRHGRWEWEEANLLWMPQRLRFYLWESQKAYSSSLFWKTNLFDSKHQPPSSSTSLPSISDEALR